MSFVARIPMRSPRLTTVGAQVPLICVTGGALALAVVALGDGLVERLGLVAVQLIGVVALVLLGMRGDARGWATTTTVVAGAWLVLLTLPALAYAIDPSLLRPRLDPTAALGLVNVSLFALLLGWIGIDRLRPSESPRRPELVWSNWRPRAALLWVAVSAVSVGVLFARNGGPASYLSNLDDTGNLTAGLTYVVGGVLTAKFAAFVRLARRWSRGEPADREAIALLVTALALVALIGARAFVAIALVQLLLLWALLRRRVHWLPVVAAGLVVGFVLVFGLGTVKRYQGYENSGAGEGVSFVKYVRDIAVGEAVDVYVSNYVDSVQTIAIARNVVPEAAGYEHGRLAIRLAVQPIPRGLRPDVARSPAIDAALRPDPSHPVALPLQAVTYLQFGVPAVIVAFVALGVAIALADRALHARQLTPPMLLALIATATGAPMLLRSGIPDGVAIAGLDIALALIVAVTLAGRRLRPPAP